MTILLIDKVVKNQKVAEVEGRDGPVLSPKAKPHSGQYHQCYGQHKREFSHHWPARMHEYSISAI
jgi:hypothetical protein